VQPIGDSLPRPHRGCFAGKYQKGRLKSVFSVVMIANDTTANPEDHGAMTTDKGVKGRFIVLFDEGRQQLPIRPVRPIGPQHDPAEMLDDPAYRSGCQ